MKKFFTLLIAVFALFALTACSHKHTIDNWSVDYYKHWHVCTECGEQTDISAHDFNKNEICIVCNSKVVINDNASVTVTVYDENGNAVRELVFDMEGNLINSAQNQ